MSTTSNVTGASGDPLVYDPSAPVPYWHQDLELSFICIFNAMTLILIIARVTIRRIRLKKFRRDDIWIMVAGGLLIFPHWVSQIGTNHYGSGLHVWNIPDSYHIPFFQFEWGWVGYYIVASMIKVSVCASLLEILPPQFTRLRIAVYMLCGIICALGIAESCVWIFQCQPFLSNFIYSIPFDWCVNVDAARYAWVCISVIIDFCIVCIPFAIIRQIRLQTHERVVLLVVFGANLLGTVACALGIYGIWYNSTSYAYSDDSWTDSIFIMTSDVEIFLYALGASATMASRYFISKAESCSNRSNSRSSDNHSWQAPNISWPTSNESFYSNPVKPSKPQHTKSGLSLNINFKRGFKSPQVDLLEEGIDLQESPQQRRPTFESIGSASSPQTPRTPHPLLNNYDGKSYPLGSAASTPRTPGAGMGLALNDVGGLAMSSTEKDPARSLFGSRNARKEQERRQRFPPPDWESQDDIAPITPTERYGAEPWEGKGPINGWENRR